MVQHLPANVHQLYPICANREFYAMGTMSQGCSYQVMRCASGKKPSLSARICVQPSCKLDALLHLNRVSISLYTLFSGLGSSTRMYTQRMQISNFRSILAPAPARHLYYYTRGKDAGWDL